MLNNKVALGVVGVVALCIGMAKAAGEGVSYRYEGRDWTGTCATVSFCNSSYFLNFLCLWILISQFCI